MAQIPAQAAKSSPTRVFDAIADGILAGRYVPGQRLTEADMTRELAVSRGPVREAFTRLASAGILTLTPNRGAYIRAHSRASMSDTLAVLEALTGLAASLAAQRIHEPGNQRLLATALQQLLAFEDQTESLAYFEARRKFYDCLLAIADNRELSRSMPQMQINLLRLQFQGYVTGPQRRRSFDDYRAIAQAVMAGDAVAAERETRKHLHRRRENLAALPDAAFGAARPEH